MRSTAAIEEQVWILWYTGERAATICTEYGLTPVALRAIFARALERSLTAGSIRRITCLCSACGGGTGPALGMRLAEGPHAGRPHCALCALDISEEYDSSLKGFIAP